MSDVSNKAPPPAVLPNLLPTRDVGLANTTSFALKKKQRLANALHEQQARPRDTAVRSNRSDPGNRRGVDLREQAKSDAAVQADNFNDDQALDGDEPRGTPRQSIRPTLRQDRSEFTSGPPALSTFGSPQTGNPVAQTRSATAARYTSPEHRRGTSSTGASNSSGFEGASEQLVSMNGEQLPRSFVDMVRSSKATVQQSAQGSEAQTTEGHEVAREEHAEAQVQTSLTSATNATQAQHAPFSKSCVAAATQAALLGMGPTLRKNLLTGANQRSIFSKSTVADGDADASASGPVDRVVNFQTGQVVYQAPPEDEKVDWL